MTCSITRSRSQVASLLRLPDSHSIHTCRSAPGRAIPHSSRRIARFRCFHTVLPHAHAALGAGSTVRSPRETLTQNNTEYSASPDVRAQGAARLTGKSERPCRPQGSNTGKMRGCRELNPGEAPRQPYSVEITLVECRSWARGGALTRTRCTWSRPWCPRTRRAWRARRGGRGARRSGSRAR